MGTAMAGAVKPPERGLAIDSYSLSDMFDTVAVPSRTPAPMALPGRGHP